MLDGIEQPGDRRLLKDIAETPQASADAWRDGYDYGKKQWKVCGYVEGMHQAHRLLVATAANTDNQAVKDYLNGTSDTLLRWAKDAINSGLMDAANPVDERPTGA